MLIAYEAKRLFNNLTGLGNYARTLVRNVQNDSPGDRIILYAPKAGNNPDTHYFFDQERFTIVTAPRGLSGKVWRSWSVSGNIKRDKPAIYHGLSHDLPFSVGKKHPGPTKYVVTIHDVCYRSFPVMYPASERLIYKLKYSHSLKIADAIIAISESTKNDILKYFPRVNPAKIRVIYQALDPVYYEIPNQEHAAEVVARYGADVKNGFNLYVGSINSRKNLLGIVRAYSLIPEEERRQLVIIGSGGSYKEKVEKYADENNLGQHLLFLDKVTMPENLRDFYLAAQIVIYPSFFEGFGLPVAEALLCRTPVVTSNISSLPEAAGPGALYVNPASEEQISLAIQKLQNDPALREALANEGHDYVLRRFDPRKLTREMLDLYHELANKIEAEK